MSLAQRIVTAYYKAGLIKVAENDGQPVKPRIKAGFRTENGFTYLYVNGRVAGYRMPEYVYFKGKKIFT